MCLINSVIVDLKSSLKAAGHMDENATYQDLTNRPEQ